MRTTIALRPANRDRLLELKRRWGASSTDDVIARLLDGPVQDAKTLFEQNKQAVRTALRKNKARKLIAFGSRAKGAGRPDSDLDLAVVFAPGADLFDLFHLKEDLTAAFGVTVDVTTADNAEGPLLQAIKRGVVLVG